VSVARASPAFAAEIIPALERRESVRVDFPWSTWAMTDMLRTFVGLSIKARTSSTVKLHSTYILATVVFPLTPTDEVVDPASASRDLEDLEDFADALSPLLELTGQNCTHLTMLAVLLRKAD
jgi:hypothetical protein